MNEVLSLVNEAIASHDVKTIAVVAAFVLAGVIGLMAVLKRLRALVQKARSAALARSMLSQAGPAELVPPPERAKHVELEARFSESLARLRRSKLGGGGERALYTLPFQVLMGPSGAGKTTLIRGSGLEFLQGSEKIESIPGIGGTRDCNWWFTNHGIILDTAGRYACDDVDHDEWIAFLRLLRQHRSEKPIDGVIIAVGIDSLMVERRELGEPAALAGDLRRRVDELCQELDVIVPVYILITKCDLLPGFRESFAEMSERDREQIWGFTLPLLLEHPIEEVFEREYDALLDRIETRTSWRVDLDRSRPDRQASVLTLLSALQALAGDLSSLVCGLMRPDRYRHEPLLRGVYFTSGSQEGQPLAHLRQGMGSWVSTPSDGDEARSSAREITFFVKRLFLDVIFPDKSLARRTDIELRRARVRSAVTLASGAAAVLSSYLAVSGALGANRALIERASAAVTHLRGVDGGELRLDAAAIHDLSHLVGLVETLQQHREDGGPLRLRIFGFYRGDQVAEPLERFVVATLGAVIHRPVFSALLDELRVLAQRTDGQALTAREAHGLYGALRHYLLVTRRADDFGRPTRHVSEEPELSEHAREIELHIYRFWRSLGPGLPAAVLRRIARVVARGLVTSSSTFFLRSDEIVVAARKILDPYYPESRCDLAGLEAMIRAEDIDLAGLTGGDPFPLRAGGDARVPAFFTRSAWDQARRLYRSPGSLCADGDWVLGRARVGGRTQGQRVDGLMSEYAVSYSKRWRSFIESISIDFGRGCGQVEIALDALTTPNSALNRLISGLRYHMHVDGGDGSVDALSPWLRLVLEQGGSTPRATDGSTVPTRTKLSEDGIWRDFLGLESFCPQTTGSEAAAPCEDLRAAWSKLSELPITPESGDDAGATQVISEGQREVQHILDGVDSRWRPWLYRLTGAMSDQIEMCVASNALCVLDRAWWEQIAAPWEQAITRKFPFARNAFVDASPDDVRAILGAEGALWRFYEERVSAVIPRDGAGSFRRGGRVGAIDGASFAGSIVRVLSDASRVGRALLDESSVEVTVNPIEHPDFFVERTTLQVGGQTYSFTNAKHRPQRIPWPLSGEEGVRLSVSGRRTRASMLGSGGNGSGEPMEQTLYYPGSWGLLRLIDDSRVRVLAAGERLVLTKTLHDLMGAEVVIEVGLNPTAAAIFRGDVGRRADPLVMVRSLEPPPAILSVGSSCGPRSGEETGR